MIVGQIQDILEYFNFSGASKFVVQKRWKRVYSIERFLSQKVSEREHSYINTIFKKLFI